MFEFTLRDATNATAEIASQYVVYRNGLAGGVHVIIRPSLTGFEDYFLFENRPSSSQISYEVTLPVAVAGLRLVSNTLEFLDQTGTPLLHLSPPFLVDSRGITTRATISVSGCDVDTRARMPWRRSPEPAGNTMCQVAVTWNDAGITYPAMLDPSWSTADEMAIPRFDFESLTLKNTTPQYAVALGGYDGSYNYSDAVEFFDPDTATWSTGPSMNSPRAFSASVSFNINGADQVFVTGGFTDMASTQADNSTEILSQDSGGNYTWTTSSPMSSLRALHSATMMGNQVLLAGGTDGTSVVPSCEMYNLSSQTFSPSPPDMIEPRSGGTAALLPDGQSVIVAGGGNDTSSALASAEEFTGGQWLQLADMPSSHFFQAGITLKDGRVMVAGGVYFDGSGQGVFSTEADLFDYRKGTWTMSSIGSAGRAAMPGTPLANGGALLGSGETDDNIVTTDASLFDAETGGFGGWSLTSTSATHDFGGAATLTRSDGTSAAAVFGGVTADGATHGVTDVLALSPNGVSCGGNAECQSDFCAAGVCDSYPEYNRVYGIATHNSYWVNRSDQADYFSSGTQELISDQLLHEHVRALEIDIHSEGAPDHNFKVYHTSDSEDFNCRYLADCLAYLRNFHYATPAHEPINVIIELHNVVAYTGAFVNGVHTNFNFDDTHTMGDFDQIFRDALGDALYTPSDFLARCDSGSTMRQCAAAQGWPTIDQLRGKFIINIIGNWSTAAYDWVQYAGQDISTRVAFPIQSVFSLASGSCSGESGGANAQVTLNFDSGSIWPTVCVSDIDDRFDPSPTIDDSMRQAAFDASVFWQYEYTQDIFGPPVADPATPSIVSQFLTDNGVIRGHDAFEYGTDCVSDSDSQNCQDAHIRRGFQLIMTDYPWFFVSNTPGPGGIPTDASQRLRDPASLPDTNGLVGPHQTFHEHGSRFYFDTTTEYPGIWRYATVPSDAQRWWETTVSSTRHGDTWGEYTQLDLDLIPSLQDYEQTCPGSPHPSDSGPNSCTNYPRVAAEDGEACIKVMSDSETDGTEICRQKNTTSGASFYQESVDLYVTVFRNGQVAFNEEYPAPRYASCKSADDPNSNDVADSPCIGSMIAVGVTNSAGTAQVVIYSAGDTWPLGAPPAGSLIPGAPKWNVVHSESFSVPLTKQGFRGWKQELLAGSRVADQITADSLPNPGRLRQISLADLPAEEDAPGGSGTVVDLSY